MRRAAALAALIVLGACARPPLELPTGPSTPIADPAPIVEAAQAHCDGLRTLTAELGLSGRVGSQKLRGRLLAGFETPDAIRLEGLAPFGEPVFILAGRGGQATLWMPRERQVLPSADPSAIIEALAGVRLGPEELRGWLAGCAAGSLSGEAGRQYGDEWVALDAGDGTVWLRRQRGAWRLAAVERDGLVVEFGAEAGVQPTHVRVRRTAGASLPAVDLSLAVRGVEMNVDLSAEAFKVNVPDTADEITVEDLRRSGPLRDVAPGTSETR